MVPPTPPLALPGITSHQPSSGAIADFAANVSAAPDSSALALPPPQTYLTLGSPGPVLRDDCEEVAATASSTPSSLQLLPLQASVGGYPLLFILNENDRAAGIMTPKGKHSLKAGYVAAQKLWANAPQVDQTTVYCIAAPGSSTIGFSPFQQPHAVISIADINLSRESAWFRALFSVPGLLPKQVIVVDIHPEISNIYLEIEQRRHLAQDLAKLFVASMEEMKHKLSLVRPEIVHGMQRLADIYGFNRLSKTCREIRRQQK